jgi:hypothetical protein
MCQLKISRIPKSWQEENILSAQKIYEEQKKPVIFFSGGLDSNVAAESFRLAKVPYEIFIMRYNNGWNDYDIKYAIDWCKAYNIKYTLYDADVYTFWKHLEWLDIAYETRTTSPQLIYYMYASTKVDGYPIFGLGEPDLTREKSGEISGIHGKEERSFKLFLKGAGEASFFNHTLEQKISWYIENETIKFINGTKYITAGDNHSSDLEDGFIDCLMCHKNEFYKSFYPNLVKRKPIVNYYKEQRNGHIRRFGKPMTDYTGFDRLPKHVFDLEHEIRWYLIEKIGYLSSNYIEFKDEWYLYDKYIQDVLTEDLYNKTLEKINGIQDCA